MCCISLPLEVEIQFPIVASSPLLWFGSNSTFSMQQRGQRLGTLTGQLGVSGYLVSSDSVKLSYSLHLPQVLL